MVVTFSEVKSFLTDSILSLDHQYTTNPRPELYKECTSLQAEFDLLSTKQAGHMLLQSHGNYYEYGDKESHLLAHQLKHQASSCLIPQIRDSSDNHWH